eukprot:6190450-Pleurochrysis_carterae.AAC.1
MYEDAREECTARARRLLDRGSRCATWHSKRPPRRMNGRSLRCPEASGGNSRARILAKRQSVLSVDQS